MPDRVVDWDVIDVAVAPLVVVVAGAADVDNDVEDDEWNVLTRVRGQRNQIHSPPKALTPNNADASESHVALVRVEVVNDLGIVFDYFT